MIRNQRLLVALSNTEHDVALLEYARLLASCGLGREFRFAHVAAGHAGTGAVQTLPAGDTAASGVLRAVETHFGAPPAGSISSCHVLAGERVDALLEFATRSRTDIILLGHRRHRSGQRSLARRLAMIAPASVWMVPEGAPTAIRSVLAPVDYSEHSADSLEVAAAIAVAARAERCQAMHVTFDPSTVRYPEQIEAEQVREQDALRAFLAAAHTPGVRVEPLVEEGAWPPRTILHVAQREASDLIVMNTRGRSRAAAVLLGSVTTQVMVETPVAVLAVKHFGAAMGLFQALKESHFWQQPLPKSN